MKVKVIVESGTGATSTPAELCLQSGIIRFESGEFTHISKVVKVYEAPTAPKLELVTPGEPPVRLSTSAERRASGKESKKK